MFVANTHKYPMIEINQCPVFLIRSNPTTAFRDVGVETWPPSLQLPSVLSPPLYVTHYRTCHS